MDIIRLTAIELRQAIADQTITSRQAVQAHLDQIQTHDNVIHAFTCLQADAALTAADLIDEKIAAGKAVGKLAGVPVAIKDNIHVAGMPTSCASQILKDFTPPYASHVSECLLNEGAIILGKTNLDEFAMGSSTENSSLFSTRNPWDTERVPGGSSGGSAAAVAAGFAPLTLGSDTGGSIRQPASFCGVVGFKPTYGMVSRYGLIAFGSSLDQIGPFARTTLDVALMMDCIAGHDQRDSTSASQTPPDFLSTTQSGIAGLKVGIPVEYFGDGLDPEVEACIRVAIKAIEAAGAEVIDVSLPNTEFAVPVYYLVATAEASSNLARYDGVHYGHRTEKAEDIISLFSRSREEAFGPEVKRRIMLGTYALSAGYYDAYYLRALKVRTLIVKDFAKAYEKVDVIMSPVSPSVAFKAGEKSEDPLAMYLSDIYTISANLAGIPAISLPAGTAHGMPVGLQIMGHHFEDGRVLATAHALESILGNSNQLAALS